MRPWISRLVAVTVVVAACGGSETAESTGFTAAPTTTSTAPLTITSTASPTTTTTIPATTTTTTLLPVIPVLGWQGSGIREIGVAVEFVPPIAALDMEYLVRSALTTMGLAVVESAETVMTFDLDGQARSRTYSHTEVCYTGAEVSGEVTLTGPGEAPLHERIYGEVDTPQAVFLSMCERDPDFAPFDQAFEPPFMRALIKMFGVATAPAIAAVVDRTVRNSRAEMPLRADLMDAFSAMDPVDISLAVHHRFIEGTIATLEYFLGVDTDAMGADAAARRALTEYSGTDFGADSSGVAAWREWFDGWFANRVAAEGCPSGLQDRCEEVSE